jgi:hypothetical protein
MKLLIIVSRLPSTVAVTVTVKGEPAVTVGGAVKLRIAWAFPQPEAIDNVIKAVNARSCRAGGCLRVPKRCGFLINLTIEPTNRELALYAPFLRSLPNRTQAAEMLQFHC